MMQLGRIVLGLLAGAGLLAAFSTSSALAQDEEFCRTYAYEAVEAAKQHRNSQCGGDLTKYSLNEADHYRVCMYWGADAMKYATRETNTRAQEFYNCKAEQAGVAAVDLGHTEYENDYPRPGDKFGFCSNYAFWATTQRGVSLQQGCNFSEESGRWGESFNAHRDWCMSLNFYDAGALSGEINNRTNELVQCQTAAATPIVPGFGFGDVTGKTQEQCLASYGTCEATAVSYGPANAPGIVASECTPRLNVCMNEAVRAAVDVGGNTKRVKLDVDLYDAPEGGNVKDVVRRGTEVVVGACEVNNRCRITGAGGLEGWIYDGNDYDTLDR
jgi:hypothetical protein